MYGLPGQTLAQLEQTLQAAVNLGVGHVSVYGLKVEPNTLFFRWKQEGELDLPEEALELQMEELIGRYLTEQGLFRYEISNYARPGYESQHNLKYWDLEEYLGLGVDAHSYLKGKPNVRFFNCPTLRDYLGFFGANRVVHSPKEALENVDYLTPTDDVEEYIMLKLRKTKGMNLEEFICRFGRQYLEKIDAVMHMLEENGFAKRQKGRFYLTPRGLQVQNAAVVELIRYL